MSEWIGSCGFEGQTYATEEVVLEVELEVGVLLNGAEDLKSVVRESWIYGGNDAHTLTPSAVTF
jgi:hypothetical protein